MGIIKKVKTVYQQIDVIKGYNTWFKSLSSNRIFINYLYCHYRYGVSITKYEQYEFCRLNHLGRKSFVSERYGRTIWNASNPKEARSITGDKAKFNKRFESFLHRSFINVETATFEEFCGFVEKTKSFISKPFYGASGKGIEIIQNDGNLPLKDLYQQYKSTNCLLEEVVVQNHEMAELHPSSLNTMRIATLRDGERIVIMGAAFRIGTGKEVVDNFHKNGIVAAIDVETGIVKSTGINFRHQRFLKHPDTGKQIIGFQIPNWDKVLKTVKNAAELLPEMDYVGWDVAIDANNNVLLIEGNSIPDYDVLQIATQEGLYNRFKPIIDRKNKCKRV